MKNSVVSFAWAKLSSWMNKVGLSSNLVCLKKFKAFFLIFKAKIWAPISLIKIFCKPQMVTQFTIQSFLTVFWVPFLRAVRILFWKTNGISILWGFVNGRWQRNSQFGICVSCFECCFSMLSEFFSEKPMASEFFVILLTEEGASIPCSELSASHTSL